MKQIFDFIVEHYQIIVLCLIGMFEFFLRIIPTEHNYSLISRVLRLLIFVLKLIPNQGVEPGTGMKVEENRVQPLSRKERRQRRREVFNYDDFKLDK